MIDWIDRLPVRVVASTCAVGFAVPLGALTWVFLFGEPPSSENARVASLVSYVVGVIGFVGWVHIAIRGRIPKWLMGENVDMGVGAWIIAAAIVVLVGLFFLVLASA